jgi:hypothetical protein
LPEPKHQLRARCNVVITHVLAAVVSGASVTLYRPAGKSGATFKGLLRDFYPWNLEPGNKVTPTDGANVIYSVIRNPLTHDLGLDLEKKRKTQKIILKRLSTDGGKRGLPERLVAQMEKGGRFTMSPTLTITPGRTVLLVEAFYWGVRTMIESLLHDRQRMQDANAFLSSI